MNSPGPAIGLLRGALAAWLVGWFVLSHALGPYFVGVIRGIPVRQPFFPGPFGEPLVASAAYLLPIGLVGFVVRPTREGLRVGALLAIACSATLMLHADAYNDATFLASFWLGLWMLWVAGQSARTDVALVHEASGLLVAIGAFVFLGGVVGKLHAEWWSGDVYAHVLIDERTFWFFPWVRTHLPPAEQMLIARWLARVGLGCEIVAVLTPLLPLRWGLGILVAASLGVIAAAGWTLTSVLGGLVGSALACLWALRTTSAAIARDSASRAAIP